MPNQNHEARLELHPKAIQAFDSKCVDLLDHLSPDKEPSKKGSADSVVPPEAHVAATISGDQILSVGHRHTVDITGHDVGRSFFQKGTGWMGLRDSGYTRLLELAEAIQGRRELNPFLSKSFVETEVFNWLEKRRLGEDVGSPLERLLQVASEAVMEYEVWIPIPTLSTIEPFQVGKVLYKPITRKLVGAWEANIGEDTTPERSAEYVKELRRTIQGLAAATLTVKAEPIRAQEIALEHAELSTAALRLFSPEILHPYGRSFWEPLSFHERVGFDVILLHDSKFKHRNQNISRDSIGHGTLDREKIVFLFEAGLARMDSLLRLESPSPFQRDCLNALVQYSKTALKRDPSEKLLYIISAFEILSAHSRRYF